MPSSALKKKTELIDSPWTLTSYSCPLRYCVSFLETLTSDRARISAASSPAFVPLSRPTVPTGTPEGNWTIARIDSRFSFPETGTPITGFVDNYATKPGRAAERPAIVMKPSALDVSTSLSSSLWFRWLDRTFVSYGTPSLSRMISAFFAISRSLSDPIRILTLLVIDDPVSHETQSQPYPLVHQTDLGALDR